MLATSPQFVTNEEVNFPFLYFLCIIMVHSFHFKSQLIKTQYFLLQSPESQYIYTLQYYQIIHSIYKIIPSISFTRNRILTVKNYIILYSIIYNSPCCLCLPRSNGYLVNGNCLWVTLHTCLVFTVFAQGR